MMMYLMILCILGRHSRCIWASYTITTTNIITKIQLSLSSFHGKFDKFSFNERYVPNGAMKTDQVLEFDINISEKKKCKLSPAKYFVKKIQRISPMGEDQLVFHAAKYESYSLGISPQPIFPEDQNTK